MGQYCTILLLFFALLLITTTFARITVVSGLFEWQLRDMVDSYIDNFMRLTSNCHAIIFLDGRSLEYLQRKYQAIPDKRVFVMASFDSFESVFALNSTAEHVQASKAKMNKELMFTIEKFFFVNHAISVENIRSKSRILSLEEIRTFTSGQSLKSQTPTTIAKPAEGYVWVDIDSISSINFFPLFIGFPDTRKLQHPGHKIVVISNSLAVPLQEYQQNNENSNNNLHYYFSVPSDTIMIGGSQAWERAAESLRSMLLDTARAGGVSSYHHVQHWLSMIQLTPFAANEISKTFSESEIFLTLFLNRVNDLFCHFSGNQVHLESENVVLHAHLYLLYQYSANSHTHGDLRCADERMFQNSLTQEKKRSFEILLP